MAKRMDIYQKLHQEHESVSKLLQQLSQTSAKDSEKRRSLFQKLNQENKAHSVAEHRTLYRELAQQNQTRGMIMESEAEHHMVTVLLGELSNQAMDTERWAAKLRVLKEMVQHHLRVEEQDVFAKARELFSDDHTVELTQAFAAQKRNAMAELQKRQ